MGRLKSRPMDLSKLPLVLLLAALRRGAAAGAAAARGAAARGLLAGVLGRRCVLLARELAVAVLVELREVLVVRRAFRFLAGNRAVLVLVQGLEHLFRARGARARGGALVRRRTARALVAARIGGHGKACGDCKGNHCP